MNIILIGIQGCGKGTLVSGLEKNFDLSLISMGQLLRDEIATGSELGKKIKTTIDKGELVSLDIVTDALKKKLADTQKELTIFDGFPRNSIQADVLNEITKVDLVIHLNLSKEVAIERILNRLTCEKCGHITQKQLVSSDVCPQCSGKLAQRSDDTVEGVNKRFEVYEKETYPLLEKYKNQGVRVVTIDSIDKDTTLKAVLKVINEYNN